ncbi:hypothetical protein ACFSSC_09155 [Corynebacterium mendelii]|uniref:Phenol hydroxylase n=1 Tax=Corynebacterium mendelii TaxID=2765362 RepID=A0A939E1B1_9CORY|nr:hypothetical protein [Corynebacterium mendelii]MBN9645144.1 hypothetical protein [Corynebacterium mendelii]
MTGTGASTRGGDNPGPPPGAAAAGKNVGDDRWLDGHRQPRQVAGRHPAWAVAKETFAQPLAYTRRMVTFAATSPGVMTLITLVLIVAIGAAGFSLSQSSATRQDKLTQLITNTEPVAFAAHNLYTSLSMADTTATTGFAQAGIEDAATRERYMQAIQRATLSATEAAAGISGGDEQAIGIIVTVQQELPVYAGLVETARANNRAGNPVGSAYLAEASHVMRDTILPAAAQLFDHTSAQVTRQQDILTRPQWVPISGLVAALLMLVAAQIWLWWRTRRRLNKGFVAATVVMLVALMWTCGASFAMWYSGTRSFEEAATPLASLTEARIVAQQTRTAETLALVRRQKTNNAEREFTDATTLINNALDQYSRQAAADNHQLREEIQRAKNDVARWRTAHDLFTAAEKNGEFDRASAIALGTGEPPAADRTHTETPSPAQTPPQPVPSAVDAFDSLDANLAGLITHARTVMRAHLNTGLAATRLLSAVVMVLSLLAMIAVALGMRRRLQEYL